VRVIHILNVVITFPIAPPRTVQAPFDAYGSQTVAVFLHWSLYGIHRNQLLDSSPWS